MSNPPPEPSPLLPGPPDLPPRRRRGRRRPKQERLPWRQRFSNALLGWEVLRAGRRSGSIALARTVLGGSLLVAIWMLYSATFGDGASVTDTSAQIGKQLNTFAERFALTFFVVQATAVLLLTPVYVAGAIFEERDTRSGEVLLTTQLTRREVYIGKLGARMVQVLLVVLAGMPILFLTALWGGVSVEMILVCYTATFSAIVGAGVITAAVSAYAESMRSALLRTYGTLLLVDGAIIPASPYAVIVLAAQHWFAGLVFLLLYLPLQLGIVLIGYSIGQRWLRMAMLRQKRSPKPRYGQPPPLPGTDDHRPPLDDMVDPLLWKERNTRSRVRLREGLRCLAQLPVANSSDSIEQMGFWRWLFVARDSGAYVARCVTLATLACLLLFVLCGIIPSPWAARVGGFAVVMWLLVAVGFSAASGIANERHKQTLIDLLMLPRPRCALLHAKLYGALLRTLWPTVLLATWLLMVFLNGGLATTAYWLLLVAAFGFVLFAAGLGIWLSARCRTQLHALAAWLGVVGGMGVGTFLLAEANMDRVQRGARNKMDYPLWSRTVNPGIAWATLCYRADPEGPGFCTGPKTQPWPITPTEIRAASTCTLLYGLLGVGCYLLAVRRFEREGRA